MECLDTSWTFFLFQGHLGFSSQGPGSSLSTRCPAPSLSTIIDSVPSTIDGLIS